LDLTVTDIMELK